MIILNKYNKIKNFLMKKILNFKFEKNILKKHEFKYIYFYFLKIYNHLYKYNKKDSIMYYLNNKFIYKIYENNNQIIYNFNSYNYIYKNISSFNCFNYCIIINNIKIQICYFNNKVYGFGFIKNILTNNNYNYKIEKYYNEYNKLNSFVIHKNYFENKEIKINTMYSANSYK